ncbi:hypothetical protein K438DRAFT_1983410 [Mycena galopus ATCC 62051]|nr:hypothetical protein K438DRAFT_1983410 [Mycena galopus ATCC 62051]
MSACIESMRCVVRYQSMRFDLSLGNAAGAVRASLVDERVDAAAAGEVERISPIVPVVYASSSSDGDLIRVGVGVGRASPLGRCWGYTSSEMTRDTGARIVVSIRRGFLSPSARTSDVRIEAGLHAYLRGEAYRQTSACPCPFYPADAEDEQLGVDALARGRLCPVLLEDFSSSTTDTLFGNGVAGEGGMRVGLIFLASMDATRDWF